MAQYQTWLSEQFTSILEYKCNEASGDLLNTGSGSAMDLEPNGTPTYRFAIGNEHDQEAGQYMHEFTGGTSGAAGDAFFQFNHSAWNSGKTSGTIVLIVPDWAASLDYLFYLGNSYTSAAVGESLVLQNNGGKVRVECRTGSAVVWEQASSAGDLFNTNAYTSQIVVITQPADGSGMKIWVNGSYKNVEGERSDLDNPDFWFADVTTPVVTSVMGVATSADSGASLSSVLNPAAGELEYLACFNEVFTADNVRDLMSQYYGGGTITEFTTRSGRNKQRRVWNNQIDGGRLPSGIETIKDMMVGNGSSVNWNIYNFLFVGQDRILQLSEDDEWGEFMQVSTRGNLNSAPNSWGISPNGQWLGVNDSTSSASTSTWPLGVWNMEGFWMGAHRLWDDIIAGGSPSQGACDWHEDGLYAVASQTNQIPALWVYDAVRSRWVAQTAASTFETSPVRFSLSTSRQNISFGKGTTKDYLAYGSNASSNRGHHIYELNKTTNQFEDVTYTTQPLRRGYGAYVSPVRDHIFFSEQTTATTPSDTGASQIFAYKRTGAKTWTSDKDLLNNGVAHPDQTATNTTVNNFLAFGDSLYATCEDTRLTVNILHWEWNGTYYAAQSSVEWPGDGVYSRHGHNMYLTEDGEFFMVTCNNGGSGAGDPCILSYSRDTTTGALTLLDTPHPFMDTTNAGASADGYVLADSSADYTNQSPRRITARESYPLTQLITLFVSNFHCLYNPIFSYHFNQVDGDDLLTSSQPGDVADWDMPEEGSGHSFSLTGGDGDPNKASTAIELNGSGGWLRGTPGTELNSSTGGTFVLCGKYTSSNSTDIMRFSNAADDGDEEIVIGVDGSGDVFLESRDAVGQDGIKTDGGGFDDGAYHIWVFTKSGTALNCYVDGVLIGSAATMTTGYWFNSIVPGTNCDHIGIGGRPNAGGTALTARFVGFLDYVGYTNSVLSPAAVTALSWNYLAGR